MLFAMVFQFLTGHRHRCICLIDVAGYSSKFFKWDAGSGPGCVNGGAVEFQGLLVNSEKSNVFLAHCALILHGVNQGPKLRKFPGISADFLAER